MAFLQYFTVCGQQPLEGFVIDFPVGIKDPFVHVGKDDFSQKQIPAARFSA